ncbi:MAG: efflux RND transporter periplasmic adaptor subunit [Terriglobales bacterium]
MSTETKHEALDKLRIDREARNGGEMPRWSRRYILAGIVVIGTLGALALIYRMIFPAAPQVEVARASAVSGEEPGVVLNASGYVVAHHKINVNSKVTGRVAWIGVEKGDRVKQGQVLVRLEDEEFRATVEQARGQMEAAKAYLEQLQRGSRPEEIAQAQANLDEARATLLNDQITLERTRSLVEQGVSSKQALDDATARYNASRQRVESLEKVYELAKLGPRQEEIARARGNLISAQGQLAFAESQLAATQIRAPVDGTILERTAEKGELITAQFASGAEGGPRGSVVALADLTDLQVELDISQSDFARLSPNQRGIISTDAFPDRKYEGVIAEISPEANRQKATVQVKVKVLAPDNYLKPDMNATVQFLSNEAPKAASGKPGVLVPIASLRESEGKKFVFDARDGNAHLREVRVLEQRSTGYLVDGLNGGEQVVVNPPADLKDGARIRVKSR